ncbi:UDP-N-acetylmuramoyl-tripeptide--D-alanyl-D-alanine ligase [Candidatus Uhrbacteria bacterium]|nr:UDP-N-acetylmuramoyl-tripeptide--D-alanyl-D-alanine ligase [Candidatus Uhrbacteria bacterium]
MKAFIQRLLYRKVKRLLRKHEPRIVAVTGSVGKTSTTQAVALALQPKFRVRTAPQSYNNEFGVPLAILGVKSPGKSVMGWFKILCQTDREFPEVLVLEFGADRPGDIAALCALARPEVGVITAISPVHVEHFGTVERLMEEKATLAREVREEGLVILNADDERVAGFRAAASASVVTYGSLRPADVQGSDYAIRAREDLSFDPGESFATALFHVRTPQGETDVLLHDALGRQQMSAALAAIAVGQHFGIGLEELVAQLALHRAPPGRLRPLPGIKGSLILDDTYNAAPAAVAAALLVLQEFHPAENRRRIAILGDMAELGSYSEAEHRSAGLQAVATSGVDLLVCVGEKARGICQGAREAGMEAEQVLELPNATEAGRWLDANIRQGDVVLVKGSQSMRMEKVVKDVMAEPLRAPELLVRQYGKWLRT